MLDGYSLLISVYFFTVIMALVIPDMDVVISLVGSVAGISAGLIIPLVLHIIHCSDRGYGPYYLKLVKDIALLCVSVAGCVTGTIISMKTLIERF